MWPGYEAIYGPAYHCGSKLKWNHSLSNRMHGCSLLMMERLQDQDDSPESRVFREHYAQLVSAIQDPEALADGLFSRNIIGRGLLQEVQVDGLTKAKKTRKLLLVVQDQLVVNPCKFGEVVEALQGDSTLEFVVKKLQAAYCKQYCLVGGGVE